MLQNFIRGQEHAILHHPQHQLHLLAVRGRGLLLAPPTELAGKLGFARAALGNLAGRRYLAHHLERVVIGRAPLPWLSDQFDAFQTDFTSLNQDNLLAALLASGTLPLIMQPVQQIAGTPHGHYWDGGLIDYHLAFPYARMDSAATAENLVLYPHFSNQIIPGWLDKSLPWRRAARGQNKAWLDNVILLSPTPDFVRSLPRAKLPDRQDFLYYGLDHAARSKNWQQAIAESARLRDAFAAFVEKPDLALVQPLNF